MKKRVLFVAIWITGITGVVRAQPKDSLAALARFVHAFDLIRHPPMNIRMTINHTSDIQFLSGDAFYLEASVHLRKNSSYARFGEVEQLANDSAAIFVSDSLEQIILLSNQDRSLNGRLMGMFGMGGNDSSVRMLNTLYRAEGSGSTVKLQSRSFLSGTDIIKESAQLDLDPKTELPVQLLVFRRTIVLVDSAQMEELRQQHIPAERFVQRGQWLYLVKETQTRFAYLHIDQEDKPLPVTFANRVEKDGEGQWKPVKAYEAYRLIDRIN